ncbi:MAG TPA: PDZ domain-containing protein [Symbiobacteriaceae bacterium]|nr:PDZ domain-containing protein [Symbiobacteriaceae bacterium]
MRRSGWRYLPPLLLHLLGSLFTDLPWLNHLLPFGLGRSIHWTAVYFHPFYYAELALWILIAAVGVVRYGRKAWLDGLILVGAILVLGGCVLGATGALSIILWLLALGEVIVGAVRRAPRALAPAAALLIVGAAIFAILDFPLEEHVNLPGTLVEMDKVVQMEGGHPTGKILGLTVESRPASLIHQWIGDPLWTFLSPTDAEAKDARVTPVFLQEAHEAGLAIGLKYAGLGGDATQDIGFLVYSVTPGAPADGKIKPGDHVTKIGGRSFKNWLEAVEVIRSHKPGESVMFTLMREGKELAVELLLGANPTDKNLPYVGLEGKDAWRYKAPVPHTTTDLVAGNSYGSVFALTVMDQLTPGGITNGNLVAGTGTIDGNGKIGEVGGVPLKAYLASLSGADVLFVPASQLAEATKGAPDTLKIVPVTQFQEILDWLKAHPKP